MDAAETYPFIMGYLPEKFERKSKEELCESSEKKNEKIDQVRRLLRNEKHIKEEWFNDEVIVMYLRVRKYRVKEAFNSIKKLVSIIKKHKHLFEPLDRDTIDKCIEMGIAKFSPLRNKDGCAILNGSFHDWDPSKVSIDDLYKFMLIVFLNALSDPMTQVNGTILLFNFENTLQLGYARYVTPYYVSLMYEIMMECLPMRMKEIHFFNPNLFTKIILSILMFSEKIKKRLIMHKSSESLLKHVQGNVIPENFGGEIPMHRMKNHWVKDASLPDYVITIQKSTLN